MKPLKSFLLGYQPKPLDQNELPLVDHSLTGHMCRETYIRASSSEATLAEFVNIVPWRSAADYRLTVSSRSEVESSQPFLVSGLAPRLQFPPIDPGHKPKVACNARRPAAVFGSPRRWGFRLCCPCARATRHNKTGVEQTATWL